MDIAAMSMAMSQANVMQQASLAATKNAMEVSRQQMQGVVEMLESVPPPSPHALDVRA